MGVEVPVWSGRMGAQEFAGGTCWPASLFPSRLQDSGVAQAGPEAEREGKDERGNQSFFTSEEQPGSQGGRQWAKVSAVVGIAGWRERESRWQGWLVGLYLAID